MRDIIRILCIYHGKDIDLNTGYVLQSWVSHMTIWCLSVPFGKTMAVTIQPLQIEYLGDK